MTDTEPHDCTIVRSPSYTEPAFLLTRSYECHTRMAHITKRNQRRRHQRRRTNIIFDFLPWLINSTWRCSQSIRAVTLCSCVERVCLCSYIYCDGRRAAVNKTTTNGGHNAAQVGTDNATHSTQRTHNIGQRHKDGARSVVRKRRVASLLCDSECVACALKLCVLELRNLNACMHGERHQTMHPNRRA